MTAGPRRAIENGHGRISVFEPPLSETPSTKPQAPEKRGTGSTAIELSELRQDRSADFSPLPAVLAGPERGGLKSALLNSMAVGTGRGAFNKSGLLSPALSSFGEERENMSSGQAVVVSKRALRVGAQLDTTTRNFLPRPARHEWGEGRGALALN